MNTAGTDEVEILCGWMEPAMLAQDPTRVPLFLREIRNSDTVLRYLIGACDVDPLNVVPHFFLIQLYALRGDAGKAGSIFQQFMTGVPDMSVPAIEQAIKDHLGGAVERLSTEYVISTGSGIQNLGLYLHSVVASGKEHAFITKIGIGALMGNEQVFYTSILGEQPALQVVAPRMVCHTRSSIADLYMLTMSREEGTTPDMASLIDEELDNLLRRYAVTAAVDRSKVEHLIPEVAFSIGFNHGYLAQAMQGIHDADRSEALMAWLERSISSRGYSKEVQELVHRLVSHMRDAGFHDHIDPEKHYAFLHGDLHRFNVLQHGMEFVFIDWARCGVGPAYIDLAVLLRRFGYHRITELMDRHGMWHRLDPVGKALFSYALLLVSVMIDIDPIKNEPAGHVFIPAVRCIESALKEPSGA